MLAIALLLLLASATPHDAVRHEAGSPAGSPPFVAVPLHLDPHGRPLAAYQIDLRDAAGSARIVGIEGGDHPAFAEPPHYDPRAIQHDRVILAAFSTLPAAQLPTGRTRVATVHVMVEGDAPPRWTATLTAAGDAAGHRIDAALTLEPEGDDS